ncbi:hypothetical protein JIN85_20005 [Luteolibacter pohnpeiensis]|uniref:Uncharacterized protein n=1 Tax=Luteolibacter pohnpeiensis TaxID=454153 RepID=A0A934VSU8_9BACT|nr:hypothetical protein [Luteolibacter pohnpeiensis]
MKAAVLYTFFAIILALPLFGAGECPACGGVVTTVGKVADDETKPSKNQWVWNRSICANLLFDEDSLICTRCWLAKDKNQPDTWMRSSLLPDSFVIPLSDAIRRFPEPGNYNQRFVGKRRIESMSFWCADSPDLIGKFQNYCKQHDLTLKLTRSERYPKEVFVDVEQKPIAQQDGADQPATASEAKAGGNQKPQTEKEATPR